MYEVIILLNITMGNLFTKQFIAKVYLLYLKAIIPLISHIIVLFILKSGVVSMITLINDLF